MSKVVAIMSMSLDGFVADVNDGVAEVFDWYRTRRCRVPHRRFGPDDVPGVAGERGPPSRALVRTRCRAHRTAHVRGLNRHRRMLRSRFHHLGKVADRYDWRSGNQKPSRM